MLREFSKLRTYKSNRIIGWCVLGIGALAQINSIGRYPTNDVVFVLGGAAGITGCFILNINKNKRKAKRIEIAKIYNGETIPAKKSLR